MATSELFATERAVRVGQVWADNDSRIRDRAPRTVRIDAIEDQIFQAGGLEGHVPHARCTVLTEVGGRPAKAGKTTTIRLSRFKPTSTGYRLVQDVPETSP